MGLWSGISFRYQLAHSFPSVSKKNLKSSPFLKLRLTLGLWSRLRHSLFSRLGQSLIQTSQTGSELGFKFIIRIVLTILNYRCAHWATMQKWNNMETKTHKLLIASWRWKKKDVPLSFLTKLGVLVCILVSLPQLTFSSVLIIDCCLRGVHHPYILLVSDRD